VFALTAAAIGYLIYRSADQLAAKQVDLSKIDYRWWLGAVTVYLASMLLSAIFFDSIAAFFTSQLGKYVPGKAMVVVIRTDMIRGEGVNTKPAAASVFVETLTWLFTGAAIASLLMIVKFQEHRALQIDHRLVFKRRQLMDGHSRHPRLPAAAPRLLANIGLRFLGYCCWICFTTSRWHWCSRASSDSAARPYNRTSQCNHSGDRNSLGLASFGTIWGRRILGFAILAQEKKLGRHHWLARRVCTTACSKLTHSSFEL